MYAEVILAKASKDLDRIYHYSIPEELKNKTKVGSQVLVPFGRRQDIGYVVGFAEKTDIPPQKIKAILKTSEGQHFDEKGAALARWMADYYCSFFISALKCVMLPGGKPK